MTRISTQRGFTITELMFAMAFVSFLLLFGVTVIIQAMQIYNKGLSVRLMTQSGRQVMEDMTRSMRYAGEVRINSDARRLCTGQLSYVWNTPDDTPLNEYAGGGPEIRLVQVKDPGSVLCDPAAPTNDIVSDNVTVIVPTNLAVQCFTPIAREAGRIIDMDLIISTAGNNEPRVGSLNPNGYTCNGSTTYECPPGGEGAFCALNEFNTSVYVRS